MNTHTHKPKPKHKSILHMQNGNGLLLSGAENPETTRVRLATASTHRADGLNPLILKVRPRATSLEGRHRPACSAPRRLCPAKGEVPLSGLERELTGVLRGCPSASLISKVDRRVQARENDITTHPTLPPGQLLHRHLGMLGSVSAPRPPGHSPSSDAPGQECPLWPRHPLEATHPHPRSSAAELKTGMLPAFHRAAKAQQLSELLTLLSLYRSLDAGGPGHRVQDVRCSGPVAARDQGLPTTVGALTAGAGGTPARQAAQVSTANGLLLTPRTACGSGAPVVKTECLPG